MDGKHISVIRATIQYEKYIMDKDGDQYNCHLNKSLVPIIASHLIKNPSCLRIKDIPINPIEMGRIERIIDVSVVTTEKEIDDINNRITDAYINGMNAALEIVHRTKHIPFEYHVTPSFALGCATRDISDALHKVQQRGW